MSTSNLFTAAEQVYSEFDALTTSTREYNIPESMARALAALGVAVAAADADHQNSAQDRSTGVTHEQELDKIVNRANAAFFDARSLAMAAEGLLFKSAHGESDDDVVAARTVLDLLAAQALAMASEMDIVGIRQRRKAA